jgi:hypothetical protein
VKLFDSANPLIRLYLHVSYSLSIAFVVLMSDRIVDVIIGGKTPDSFLDLFDGKFILSLAIGASVVALMLYLHLPKMIDRCFNIGRKFGL